MFDIGGWELLVIGALALIVVGPKDLPKLVRSVGQWVGKARKLAREFQSGMEQVARESDLEELRGVGRMKSDLENNIRSAGGTVRRAMTDPAGAAKDALRGEATRAPARKPGPPPGSAAARAEYPPRAAADRSAAPSPQPEARQRSEFDDDVLDDFSRAVRDGD